MIRRCPRKLIQAHFRGDYSKIASVTNDSVEIIFSGDLEKKLLTVRAACLYPADTEIRVSFALKKGAAPADVRKPISFVKKVATTEFSLAGANPGDTYELTRRALQRERRRARAGDKISARSGRRKAMGRQSARLGRPDTDSMDPARGVRTRGGAAFKCPAGGVTTRLGPRRFRIRLNPGRRHC